MGASVPTCGRSSSAHQVVLMAGLLLAVSSNAFAQQRIIVNPTFVKRFARNGTPLPDYSASVPNSFCTQPGSCLRYLEDAKCELPSNTADVDTQGCMVGWRTTDFYDSNAREPFVQDGHIKAPTQVGIGTNLEGLNVPNGSAELNAENPGRLYQIVCLAGGEVIPYSYRLGDPTSTPSASSQARFGVFKNDTTFPGMAAGPGSVDDSTVVSTQAMVLQTGSVTAPPDAGLYQIGFEAVQPGAGATGNYISDVTITLKPLVDFAPALPIPEGQSGFLLVRVNGTVPPGGISVSLQPDAPTASPSDFTLGTPQAFGLSVVGAASLSSNGAGGYLLFIPEGAYDGNALSESRNETATNPSGSVRIPISTTADTIIEDNEVYSLIVEPPGTNSSSPIADWDLATAASCSPNPSLKGTATIVDNDIDLLTTNIVDQAAPEAGGGVTYTVTFKNNTAQPTIAPVTAHDDTATVADAMPPGLAFTSWTCAASGGARCPGGDVDGTTSGMGAIVGDALLPAGIGAAGGTLTFTINALVGGTQCDSVTNTATISVPASLQEATSADPGFTTPAAGGSSNNSASATIVPVCPGYYTLPPCRVVDTRRADGPLGGPALAAGVARDFVLAGACGIPADAVAVVLTVTAVGSSTAGSLQIYAAGGTPLAAGGTVHYKAGMARAGNGVPVLGAGGAVSVLAGQPAGTVHLVLDVVGYFLE